MKKQIMIIGVVLALVVCILAAGCTGTTTQPTEQQKQVQPSTETTRFDFTGNTVVGDWEEVKVTNNSTLKGYSAEILNDGTVNTYLNGIKVKDLSGYMDGKILRTDNDNYYYYNLVLPNNPNVEIAKVHHTPKTQRTNISVQDKYGRMTTIPMAVAGSEDLISHNNTGTEEVTPKTDNEKTTNTDKSSATLGEQNALKSAKSYLKSSAFSYNGLIEQLKYEKYTDAEAKYAADNCGADWTEQAKKSAATYMKYSSFSKQELIEQLEYEGFTHAQAVAGAASVGY